MHFFRYLLLFFVFLISWAVQAQDDEAPRTRRGSRVIDDTTKQVYGPNTSKYYYEEDVFYNRNIVYRIDTLIRNFHRFNYVQRNNYLYQDLGNIGTAIHPIYYKAPDVIGVRSGFDVYSLYWDTERIRYFDTKSPYSNMNVILGGQGRSLTRATFSRNINSRWNFGIDYRAQFIDKQIPERQAKGDRVTRSNYYDFYTAYHTKDSIYRVFANIQRIFHNVQESGGVLLNDPDSAFADYFVQNNIDPNLRAAYSDDLRTNFHFSHQVQIGKALQVYHIFDRSKQKARFRDTYATDQSYFRYRRPEVTGDAIYDASKFKVVRNEAGIKGNLLKLFYNGYYAIRHYSMTDYPTLQDSIKAGAKGDESYLGGRMELRLDSLVTVNGWAEVNQDGNYRIQGGIISKWFDASIQQLLYKPGYAEQAYFGAFHYWNNTFANIESSQVKGAIHYRSKVLNVSPGVTFTRLRNYIFFNQLNDLNNVQEVFPVQSGGNQIIFSPELNLSITLLKHINLSNSTIYTKLLENADDAIRVPEILSTTQLSYSNIFFNGNFDMQAGVEMNWRSAYFAPAYDPAIRQFYNQNTFQVNQYPLVDLFLNAKIKRGRIFLKYHNLLQMRFIRGTGYFATPFYPGMRNVIDFGFDWSFYD